MFKFLQEDSMHHCMENLPKGYNDLYSKIFIVNIIFDLLSPAEYLKSIVYIYMIKYGQ